MESPFFRNRRWYQQSDPTSNPFSPSPSFYHVDPTLETHRPVQRPGPKVVRIPVHFVGSEQQVDRTGSAVKIQKVFRGFLVRKCLKKIKDVKVEADEIEEKLRKSEIAELVRRNERERLRMNESLMSLLFKLDSICGLDFGVRVCRKAVTRKVIALQETIDAIVASHLEKEAEIRVSEEPEIGDLEGNVECGNELVDKRMEFEREDGITDVGVDCEVKVGESKESGGLVAEEGVKDENKRNRELLEKMMEDSEKMLNLMNQLFEKNEMQTKVINALTDRVELLEKAVVFDRLRKKKAAKAKTAASNKRNYDL